MKEPMAIPLAILLAGFIIAIGVYVVRSERPKDTALLVTHNALPVTLEDHILGSPTAPITIITYSDISCDYCKQLFATLEQLMSEYGASGNVAWVYRHFPLIDKHPYAAEHARAAECVANLQGTEAFFAFIRNLGAYESVPGSFTPGQYTTLLAQQGIGEAQFKTCTDSASSTLRVARDVDNALSIGIDSTPFMIIKIAGHEQQSISGALPYEALKKIIDESLKRLSEKSTTL